MQMRELATTFPVVQEHKACSCNVQQTSHAFRATNGHADLQPLQIYHVSCCDICSTLSVLTALPVLFRMATSATLHMTTFSENFH